MRELKSEGFFGIKVNWKLTVKKYLKNNCHKKFENLTVRKYLKNNGHKIFENNGHIIFENLTVKCICQRIIHKFF